MEQTSPIDKSAVAEKFLAFRKAKQNEPSPGSTNILNHISLHSNLKEGAWNGVISKLKSELRPIGTDKVRPPILRTLSRKLLSDRSYDGLSTTCSNQIIHAVMMICYQDRICRREACRRIAAWSGVPMLMVEKLFYLLATSEEKHYNPYSVSRDKRQATNRHFSRK